MAEQPSHWTILNEYSKSIITLGSSLLAAVVAFSDKFMSSAETNGRFLLGALYFFLLASIVSALLTTAFIYQCLKAKCDSNRVSETEFAKRISKTANVSYITVGFSALIFLVIGISPSRKKDVDALAGKASTIVQTIWHVDSRSCVVRSAQTEPGSRFVRVVVFDSMSRVSHTIRFDADKGDVVSLD